MIHVIATIELQQGKRAAFLREFQQVVPEVRAEKGCIEYGAATDVETPVERQASVREDVVTILERWEDVEALEAHLVADHMLAYRERIKDFVSRATLRILEPVD